MDVIESAVGRNIKNTNNGCWRLANQEKIRAELSGSNICRAGGRTVRSKTPVLDLCRELLAAGVDPGAGLTVYRRGVVALRIRSIATAARLEINSRGTGFITRPLVRGGPYVPQTTAGLSP